MEVITEKNLTGLGLYSFEENFDHKSYQASLAKNFTWVIYTSAIYAILVQRGQRWMQDQKPYNFKRALILWNSALVLFSLAVFIRMVPELYYQWKDNDFNDTLCSFGNQKSISQFWGVVFAFSKLVEFGDTLFMILHKKPIIFLHWYHHATVAIYGFYAGDINDPASRWFVLINSFVHTIMYAYYALTALGYRLPKLVSVGLTSLQISQMVVGVYINAVTAWWKYNGHQCQRSYQNIQVAAGMYASYFVLFANFFYHAYFVRSKKIK